MNVQRPASVLAVLLVVQITKVGTWLSITVTVKVHCLVNPAPSVAVHVTVVTPLLKTTPFKFVPVPVVAPDKEYAKFTVIQLSVPVAFQSVPAFVYVQTPTPVFTDWLATHVIWGASLSIIVIVFEQASVWPEPSFTSQVTVVKPLLNVTPFKDEPEPVVTPVNIYV